MQGEQFVMHDNTNPNDSKVLYPMNRIKDVIVNEDGQTLDKSLPLVTDSLDNPTTSNGFKLVKTESGELNESEQRLFE